MNPFDPACTATFFPGPLTRDQAVNQALIAVGLPLSALAVMVRERDGDRWEIRVHDRADFLQAFDRAARELEDAGAGFAEIAAHVRAEPDACPELIFFIDGRKALNFIRERGARRGVA